MFSSLSISILFCRQPRSSCTHTIAAHCTLCSWAQASCPCTPLFAHHCRSQPTLIKPACKAPSPHKLPTSAAKYQMRDRNPPPEPHSPPRLFLKSFALCIHTSKKIIWLLLRGRLCQQPSAAAGDTAAGSGEPCSPSALLKCQRPHTAYSVARYTDAGSSQPRPQSADKFCKQCPPLATLQPAKISQRIQRAEL